MTFRDHILTLVGAVILAVAIKSFAVDVVYVPSPSMEETLLPGDYLVVNKLLYGAHVAAGDFHLSGFHIPGVRPVIPGDVVVFRFPGAATEDGPVLRELFVKRCAAGPGDRIGVSDGALTINGTRCGAYRVTPSTPALAGFEGEVTIPRAGDVIDLSCKQFSFWTSVLTQEGHTVDSANGSILVDGAPQRLYTTHQDFYFMVGDNAGRSFDSRSWGLLGEQSVIGRAEFVYWSVGPPGDPSAAIRWDRIFTLVR